MTKIEELENKIKDLQKELEELKQGGEWKPREDEYYWYMGYNGTPSRTNFSPHFESDIWRVKNMPVFKTKEECQLYCNYRDALSKKHYKFSREEWANDNLCKYSISYNHEEKCFEILSWYYVNYIGELTFRTDEDAQYMIDNYSDEMLKWGLL